MFMMKIDKFDLMIQIEIIIILISIYLLWIPIIPVIIWFNPNLYMILSIIKLLVPILTIFFIIYLKQYYFPNIELLNII